MVRIFSRKLIPFALSLFVSALLCNSAAARDFYDPASGEDTILVEKEVSTKIPYHKILKSLTKRFLNFDTENTFTFGQGRRDNMIRNFNDFKERVKYRVNVDKDEVELKFSLNL